MVGIRGVFSPFEQSPFKLHCDLGDRVGRKLDQHLEQVGPHAVLRRLVVNVAWKRRKNMSDHFYALTTAFMTENMTHVLLLLVKRSSCMELHEKCLLWANMHIQHV